MTTPPERFRINAPSVVSDVIGGETIGINLDTGHYYSLRGVASDIWSLVRRRFLVHRIVEELVREYDGDAGAIESEVVCFIARLRDEGLIVPDESEVPTSEGREPGGPRAPRRFEPPSFERFTDMREFLLVDPIHEVDVTDWPRVRPRGESG
jgi:hypothetical protein